MKALALTAAALCLAGCGDSTEVPVKNGMRQTHLAGMVTAGGHTSGEIMAATAGPSAAQPGPAGTPGIPKGAEGNVGGTAMGGTTSSSTPGQAPAGPAAAASAPAAAAPGQAAASAALMPASAAASPAAADAQRQQEALAAVMDSVAERWRARAAARGIPTSPPVAEGGAGGIQASATPAESTAAPPIRSEKFGTAPPSADVKTATKARPEPVVDPKSPKQAGPSP